MPHGMAKKKEKRERERERRWRDRESRAGNVGKRRKVLCGVILFWMHSDLF